MISNTVIQRNFEQFRAISSFFISQPGHDLTVISTNDGDVASQLLVYVQENFSSFRERSLRDQNNVSPCAHHQPTADCAEAFTLTQSAHHHPTATEGALETCVPTSAGRMPLFQMLLCAQPKFDQPFEQLMGLNAPKITRGIEEIGARRVGKVSTLRSCQREVEA